MRKPAAKMGGWCEERSMNDRAGGKVERNVQQQGAMERHTNVMETAEWQLTSLIRIKAKQEEEQYIAMWCILNYAAFEIIFQII